MGNSTTPSPATTPIEAPEIKSIEELQTKKTDILTYLKSIDNMSDEEKQKFETQYTKSVEALNGRTDDEKKRILTGLNDDLRKLYTNIKNEKEDANETYDLVETDETTTPAEQKLNVESEAKAHLEEFRTSIENKLNTPETAPAETPETAVEVVPEIPDSIQESRDFFSNKGTKLDTIAAPKGEFMKNWANKILLSVYGFLEGFGIDVRGLKARAEGYKNYESKQIVDTTFKAL